MDHDQATLRQLVTDAVLGLDFRRATFGGTPRGPAVTEWVRVVVRPVEVRGQQAVQFAYFTRKQDMTKNVHGTEVALRLNEVLDCGFAGIHLTTATEEIDIRTSKKGKVQIGRRAVRATVPPELAHNRVKNYPLPEGQGNRLLEAMGILTRAGQVRPTMRAKYTQINEFLKQLQHVLDAGGLRDLGQDVRIVDCGCGAGYLTLAAHHYLNDVLGIPAQIVGVDVNAEIIRKSTARADHLGAERLQFACQRIGQGLVQPDIVLALHACDTATDDALAQAIASNARLILCVPCCHHHLNSQIRAEGASPAVHPLLRHGLLHQRTADLVTDAFRALALRIMGYRTDVVEFIDPEHTARNLMIRAVAGAPVGSPALIQEYVAMRRFWGVTPYIETVLGQPFQAMLAAGQEKVE